MIKPGEIQRKANSIGVRDQQIEKDYILSWILLAISKHVQLSEFIVFKGGTVLKKVYFDDYRFSEDLDFTCLKDALDGKTIISWFTETFDFIMTEANIPLRIIDNDSIQNNDLTKSVSFYISYIGPLGGQGNNKKVKIDISLGEKMVFNPVINKVIIPYSDLVEYELLCYSLEEVLVEKMRSIMQRMQARDFYDLWYLLQEHGLDANLLISEFQVKCKSAGINHQDFHRKLQERQVQYKSRWKSSMSEQIKNLPDYEQVEREVLRHLKKLSL